jgi:glycosyltransferase involved in cell wall biosynthesis
MKVCFIVGTLARGGAEKQLVLMLRALHRAGVATKILALTRGEFYEAEIIRGGTAVEYVGASGNQLLRLWKIVKILRRERPNIVQSSHFYTNLYAALAGKFLMIPSIGAVRSDLSYEMNSHRLTGAWQIALPDFLIVNSHFGHGRLLEHGIAPEKIEFVQNACEIETTRIVKETGKKSWLCLLFAGRLDENKRPDHFIKLAARLVKELPGIPLKFFVAGDGPLRARMEKFAAELGLLPGEMKFLGSCARMGEVYQAADILVSTSAREGTPNVVLEAMAHGLPVVATDAGGTAAILDENRGILVDNNDREDLFRATRDLILNPELRSRLGENGQRYVLKNHSLDALRNKLLKIYARLRRDQRLTEPCALKTEKTV